MEQNILNESIKRLRKEKGFTQEQLADAIGVTSQAVSKWETTGCPDAMLLPEISDFLGVTIDELFGRKKDDDICVEQKVIDYLYNIPNEEKFERAYEICFAVSQMGLSDPSIYFKPYEIYNNLTYMRYITDYGILSMRLNKEFKYFFMCPKPENSYDDFLKYDNKYVKLFAFLAKPFALKAMYYLMSSSSGMFFNAKTLSLELGIENSHALDIIKLMLDLKFIWKANYNNGNDNEDIFQFLPSPSENFIAFMNFADILINGQNYNQCYVEKRSTPFFKHKSYKSPTENTK